MGEASDKIVNTIIPVRVREFWRNLKEYARFSDLGEIGRRYFALNAFDGAMTTLGVIVGAHIGGNGSPSTIIGAGIGATIAMMVSGLTGAYMAEKAEREKDIREIEEAMFMDLSGTRLERALNYASIIAALIDGASPAAVSIVSLTPYILAVKTLIPVEYAAFLSIGIIFGLLFILGAYLGRLSGSGMVKYGFRMVLVGVATALILSAIGGLGV